MRRRGERAAGPYGRSRCLRPPAPPPRGRRGRRMMRRGERPTVLDDLAAAALARAEELRRATDLDNLYQEALLFEKRDFTGALASSGLSVVSEIKRASPSVGFISDADPAEWAARYEAEGASCLSVLTESDRFKGSLKDLDAARDRVALPAIRNDFTVDDAQELERGA